MIEKDIWVGGGSAAMNIKDLLNAILEFVLGLLKIEVPELDEVLGE